MNSLTTGTRLPTMTHQQALRTFTLVVHLFTALTLVFVQPATGSNESVLAITSPLAPELAVAPTRA